MDGVKGANLHTASKAQAAIVTAFGAAVWHKGQHTAVLGSMIFIVYGGLITVPLALHIGRHSHTFFRFHATDGRDGLPHRLTSHRAGVYGRFPFGDGGGQAAASGKTAAAAVIAGKGRQDGFLLFIHLNLEADGRDAQKSTDKQSHAAYHSHR